MPADVLNLCQHRRQPPQHRVVLIWNIDVVLDWEFEAASQPPKHPFSFSFCPEICLYFFSALAVGGGFPIAPHRYSATHRSTNTCCHHFNQFSYTFQVTFQSLEAVEEGGARVDKWKLWARNKVTIMSVCANPAVATLNDSILENMWNLPVRNSGGRRVAAHRVNHACSVPCSCLWCRSQIDSAPCLQACFSFALKRCTVYLIQQFYFSSFLF